MTTPPNDAPLVVDSDGDVWAEISGRWCSITGKSGTYATRAELDAACGPLSDDHWTIIDAMRIASTAAQISGSNAEFISSLFAAYDGDGQEN